jgi:hypothetical protein
MHLLYERVALALGNLSQRYLYDEDPEERRERLREEALTQIDAKMLPILQTQLAMQGWELELPKDRVCERQAA